jgi:hypothetical protein
MKFLNCLVRVASKNNTIMYLNSKAHRREKLRPGSGLLQGITPACLKVLKEITKHRAE